MSGISSEQNSKRNPGLDGLRGIAILMVMLFHFTLMPPVAIWDIPLNTFAHYGWTGVDLFFVLSGFLITSILLDAKGHKQYFTNFYARRMLRVFPLYYAFVAGLLILYPLVGDPGWTREAEVLRDHWWWIWFHMTNWLVARTGDFSTATPLGTGGFWSIAIEEQFYLAWPLIVLLLSERQLQWLCGAFFVLSLATRLGMTAVGLSWAAVFTVTFGRVDSLAVGALIATVARTPTGLNALRPFVFPIAIATILSFVAIEIMLRVIDRPNYTLALAVELSLIAACSGALLVGTMTANLDGIGARLTQSAILRSFGKYSFALYLFHGHLNRWFEKLGFDVYGRGAPSGAGSILAKQLLYLFMAIGFSYLLAFLSWHLYEKHFLRFKAAFPSGRIPSVSNESIEPLSSCQDSPRKSRPTSPDELVG